MGLKFKGAGSARRAVSVIAGIVAVVLMAGMAPAGASVTVDEFATPLANSAPGGITVGPDGHVWFTEVQGVNDGLGSLTPVRSGTPPFGEDRPAVTGYRLGNVTTGPDGNLWFTVMASPDIEIGRMTPGGSVSLWPVPGDPDNGVPPDIVAGPGGNLWFTENSVAEIGMITPSGTFGTPAAPPPFCGAHHENPPDPYDLAMGPDGNVWFTGSNCPMIGFVTPNGLGFAATGVPSRAFDIAAGPDGNMWFTSGSGIGKINPSTMQVSMVESQVPATSIAPSACTEALWFTSGSGSVGKITTSGTVSVYPLPTTNSNPDDITSAPDGTAWLTEPTGNGGQIARAVDTAALIPCVLLLANEYFAYRVVNLPHQGGVVGWMVQAPGSHGVADASGMNLFGFNRATGGPVAVPIGSFTSFQFDWAGAFPYDDPFHPATNGQVTVPISVAPVAGAPGAKVTWASADAPSGFGFDVQLQPPGSTDWITWQSGVTNLSAPFGPSDPLWAGAGTYRFRARLRQLTSNAASGYSAAKSITLS